jgi:hypothetical protein
MVPPASPFVQHTIPYTVLCLLRDCGAVSRAELAGRVDEPRARTLAEIDALVAGTLVREAGPAASRGGWRSASDTEAPPARSAIRCSSRSALASAAPCTALSAPVR